MTRIGRVVAVLAALSVGLPPAQAAVDTTPPVAAISVSTTLIGTVAVSFDEPVRGITKQNLEIRGIGGSARSGTLTCTDSTGASVSCLLGPARRARLVPDAHLLPGNLYTATVNPGGADPIVDLIGNAAAKTVRSVRASVAEEQTTSRATYRWDKVVTSKAYGGSFRRERAVGAKATFWFTGRSITWYTVTGRFYGTATVYIDGERVAVVNNYSSTTRYKVPRTHRGLSDGPHRLTIRVRGEKGSTSGTNTYVGVDSFVVDGVRRVLKDFYRFGEVYTSKATGGAYVRSDVRGTSVSFQFRGRGIDWYTVTGPSMGKARLYIDGTYKRTVDNYSSTTRYGVRRSVSGLPDKMHTLRIDVAGEKRSASKGRWIAIDRWVVRIPSVTVFKRLGAWVDLWDLSLDPASTASAMRARGVKTIYIQTGRYNSSTDIVSPSVMGEWIEAAHANGMKIVGWYLPAYSEYLSRDIRRTAAIATFTSPKGQGFDALAVDIEYKGKTSSLAEFNEGIVDHLAAVRARVGVSYPIGAIVPAPMGMARSPSSWTGFPWSAIGARSDVVLPMGYWSYRTKDGTCPSDPVFCAYLYTRENVERARKSTGLPVHVIGGIGNAVTTSEVRDFVRGARDEKAYGGSMYDYRTTASSFWSPLADLNRL